MRNRVIHGDDAATAEEVNSALPILDAALNQLASNVTPEVLQRALRATASKLRGTRLPSNISDAIAGALAQAEVSGESLES